MKKKLQILIVMFFIVLTSFSCFTKPLVNNKSIYKNEKLYKNYGVLLDSGSKINIKVENINGRFSPNSEDIFLAESIFMNQYNAINQASKEREGAPFVPNPKVFFWEYNRQYVGFIDGKGNRNLLMLLFDYSKKRVVKKSIGSGWQKDLVIILAEEMPFNVILYKVDLTNKILHSTF